MLDVRRKQKERGIILLMFRPSGASAVPRPTRDLRPASRDEHSTSNAVMWLPIAAAILFLVNACHYLYFFVDDEAIPYVYAQNVLNGRGLVYNAIEGRVEGYSDFLHVWLSTAILAFVRATHLPKYSVFFIGKGVSLVCGIAVVLLVWATLRHCRVATAGVVSGLAFVALAGPLAVWSCSSLETVPFALALTALAWALVTGRDIPALIAAAVVLLERTDGFIFAAALIGAFLLSADRPRRRLAIRRIVFPLAALFTVYHGWRVLYFGELLPSPLQAKVLYKLTRESTVVVKAPASPYSVRFVQLYGWPIVAVLAAASGYALWRGGTSRCLALATLALTGYVSLVGDWMFGFRFFVPVLPLFALLIGLAIDGMSRWRVVAQAVSLAFVAWIAFAAVRFVEIYKSAESSESFLHHPTRDLHRFFNRYYGIYELARRIIAPADVIAYNQAGFLPFMLDLTNIDDLGICSRVLAGMPSTDVFFTEVGKYAPLTNKRILRPANAYLLYRDARYIISRTDLLRSANAGHVPRELFGGYYELAATDSTGDNAIFRRTALAADRYQRDARVFAENVAHVSYLRRAAVDGREIARREYLANLPFLRDDASSMAFTSSWVVDLTFADADEPVDGVSIEEISVDHPVTLAINLWSSMGRPMHRERLEVTRDGRRGLSIELPRSTRASRVTLELWAGSGVPTRCRLHDLRVQGRTPKLEHYISRTLTFPPSAASGGARR